MTIEQAKSELMQIYGALSPNKQIAIDTLIKASVNPQEPKTGHWIADTFVDKCSVCGELTLFFEDQQKNFCPNCGAKMESEG